MIDLDDADDSTNSATTPNNTIRIDEENGKRTGMSPPPRIDSTSSHNSFGNGNGNILLQSSLFTVGGLMIDLDDADDSTTTTSATFLASSNILPAARTNNNNSNDKENCKRTNMLPPQPVDNSSNKKRSAPSSVSFIQNDFDRKSKQAFTTPPAKSYYASGSNNLSDRDVEEEQGHSQEYHKSIGSPSVHTTDHSNSATTNADPWLPLSSRSHHANTKDVENIATTPVPLSGNTDASRQEQDTCNNHTRIRIERDLWENVAEDGKKELESKIEELSRIKIERDDYKNKEQNEKQEGNLYRLAYETEKKEHDELKDKYFKTKQERDVLEGKKRCVIM